MKSLPALIFLAVLATGCAAAGHTPSGASRSAAAERQCKPPPQDLVVKDLETGKGDAVRFRTAVLVSYTGWLYDGCAPDLKGAEFDTSKTRATPFGFIVGVGRVIRGWDEGLIGMKEGGKRLLVIPADKAYGLKGAPPKIPPNAALVFEIELLKIIMQPPK